VLERLLTLLIGLGLLAASWGLTAFLLYKTVQTWIAEGPTFVWALWVTALFYIVLSAIRLVIKD
jgi:hypothetical protein